jgi:MerR family transcriptional regulator, heat shock protein HspR
MARNDGEGRNKPLYMISVAAELTGMHPQTLRVYEQKGLVNPGRSRGNTRLYSQADIDRLNLISKLTDEGINLAGVVRIIDMRERELELQDEVEQLREKVRKTEEELREFRVQQRITSLTRYESTNPEQVMRKLLGNGGGSEK